MTTAITPNGYRRFGDLLGPEQDRAIVALDAAAADAISGGADDAAVRAAARKHTGDLALAPDGAPVLLIEVPTMATNPLESPDPIERSAWKHNPTYGDLFDEAQRSGGPGDDREATFIGLCRSSIRVMALVDGLRLLAGPDSPARILAERRTTLAKLRSDHQERKRAAAEAATAASRHQAIAAAVGAERSRAWDRLTRDQQCLVRALVRCGQQDLADEYSREIIANLTTRVPAVPISMPEGWRTDLIGKAPSWALPPDPPSTRAGGNVSTNGETVTTATQRS